ncbi:MAG: ankyrin repeat domain-containing protein [Treponema sp.]|nr:ankyrin repeat domain-containing protein [Treponema sp.]
MTQDEIEQLSFKWTGKRSAKNVDSDTFIEACERGYIDFVYSALEYNKSLANAKNKYKKTVLMRAAHEGQKSIVKLLIENGADVNASDEYGLTPLMWAVGGNKDFSDVVKLLLETGADVNCINYCSQTALDMAEIGGLEKSIAVLKSWGGMSAN